VVRRDKGDTLDLPDDNTLQLRVDATPTAKQVLEKDEPVSAHGTVTADLTLESDAALGYYSIALLRNGRMPPEWAVFYVRSTRSPSTRSPEATSLVYCK